MVHAIYGDMDQLILHMFSREPQHAEYSSFHITHNGSSGQLTFLITLFPLRNEIAHALIQVFGSRETAGALAIQLTAKAPADSN